MDLRILQTLPPILVQSPRFQFNPPPIKIVNRRRTLRISCSKEKENLSDEILAVELALQVKKVKSEMVLREEALKKSRELLFAEICTSTGLKSEDLKKKWRKMNEEERYAMVKGFVAGWSAHFHPLSPKSVKEMVDQYVGFSDSLSANFFADFTKFLGFSPEE